MKIYMDDMRSAPDGWVRTFSVDETISALIQNYGTVTELSLDHDLGEYEPDGGDGYAVVEWLELQAHYGKGMYIPGKIAVHSANPVGRNRILAGLRSIRRIQNSA